MDAALVMRNPPLETVDADIDLALLASDAARMMRAVDQTLAACVRVRDVNLNALDAIEYADPAFGVTLREQAMKRAFPEATRRGLTGEAFDRLASMPDLPGLDEGEGVRASLEEIRGVWKMEWREASEAIVRATLRSEPRERRSSLREIVEVIDPERAARMDPGPDQVLAALQRRNQIDLRTIQMLRSMVHPEVARLLPAPVESGDETTIRAERTHEGEGP